MNKIKSASIKLKKTKLSLNKLNKIFKFKSNYHKLKNECNTQ